MQGIPSQQRQTHKTYSLAGAIGNEDDEAALIRGFNSVHIKLIVQYKYCSPSSTTAYDSPGSEPTLIKFGKDGITLEDAVQNRVPSGWDTEPIDCFSVSLSLHGNLQPVGYYPGRPSQIRVRTVQFRSMPVMKAKLASNVAKALGKMLGDYARQQPSHPDQATWVINKNVTLSDVILVEMRRIYLPQLLGHLFFPFAEGFSDEIQEFIFIVEMFLLVQLVPYSGDELIAVAKFGA
ncbi:hypothetical protein BDY19DRAFT_991423 [Irpex rosettiformis]|uniref:Uncharacterized protein n=1 Tax=Irpex rosettiformis TaxID=378272 RepID=A0ACB8UBV3_9APHY|nr:hypothetical protein BDY19DRAFT_991423 [Irpex rosettiformis]